MFNRQWVIQTLWRGRRTIAGATILCTAVAIGISFLLPKTFESSASLLLFPSPFRVAREPIRVWTKEADRESSREMEDISSLMPKVLSVPDYQILLHSDGTLVKAVEKVKKLGTWPQEDLDILDKISSLRKRMFIETQITEKTVNGVNYSPVIVLRAHAGTPEQARDLAAAWAQVAEDLSEEIYQKGKSGVKEFVEERFTSANTDLDRVGAEIRDFEIEWNDDLEHARMAKKHARLLANEEKLIDLAVEAETAKAEIAKLRTDLATEPEKRILWKSPPMTAVFLKEKEVQGASPASGGTTQESGYRDEVLNDVYTDLRKNLLAKERELASKLEFQRQLQSAQDQLAAELQALREETALRAFERRRLNLQETPLMRSYDLLSTKLEQAKIAESEMKIVPDIKIVADPVLPDRKIRPMRSFIAAFAVVLGFGASACGILLKEAVAALA